MKLKKYQETGRDFLCSRKVALLADQQRLGKSVQVIKAADKLKAKKILITCPATAKGVWYREFEKWSTMGRSVDIISGTNPRNISKNLDVTIINYDLIWHHDMKMKLLEQMYGVVVADECHYLAGRTSRRTLAMYDTKDRTPIMSRGVYRWLTSGTPITSRPREFYPTLAALAPNVIAPYLSYKAYSRRYCAGYWDGKWMDKGASHTDELNKRLTRNFMLRRVRGAVLGEVPPNYQLIPIQTHGKEIQTLITQEFRWSKEDAKYRRLEGDDHIATLRQKIGMYKVPAALQHIQYLLSLESKLVVFAYSRDVVKILHEKTPNSVMLRGGMTEKAKELAIDTFTNDPKCKVFFGNFIAAGTAIDLSVAKMIFFAEVDWSPGTIDQPADRCSGINQEEDVTVQFMVLQNSLEENMMRTMIDKRLNIKEIIEQPSIFD